MKKQRWSNVDNPYSWSETHVLISDFHKSQVVQMASYARNLNTL